MVRGDEEGTVAGTRGQHNFNTGGTLVRQQYSGVFLWTWTSQLNQYLDSMRSSQVVKWPAAKRATAVSAGRQEELG